jgi:hypothetical protein
VNGASAIMAVMSAKLIPDFTSANADLDELVAAAGRRGFDLFEYLRLFSEAGAPVFTCEIDHEAACPAGHFVAVYQLNKALKVVTAALRASNVDAREVGETA